MTRFLKDSRTFQLFGFDFVMNEEMKLWLIDVKNSPILLLKEKEMVVQMFEHIFKLNEHRNSKLYDILKALYQEIVEQVKLGNIKMANHNSFISGLKNNFIFKKKADEVRSAMRSYGDYLKIGSSFELLYDGRVGYEHLSTPSLELERFKLKLKYSKIDLA